MILLDTHVFVWAATGDRALSRPAQRALKQWPRRYLADISLREVAMLERAGRLEVDGPVWEWLEDAIDELKVEVVGVTPRIAARSAHIGQTFHGDPADQLIAATAIELDVPLVTADERLRASPAVRTLW